MLLLLIKFSLTEAQKRAVHHEESVGDAPSQVNRVQFTSKVQQSSAVI